MKTKVLYTANAYHTQRDWVGKTKVLNSRSAYGCDKSHTEKTKTGPFIYPVVYSVKADGELNLYWSSRNDNGHFGIPKIIWGWGAGIFIDRKGEYGMTQFASAIVDEPENLENIARAMKTEKFLEIMKAVSTMAGVYNYKIIRELRHDFWKEFL